MKNDKVERVPTTENETKVKFQSTPGSVAAFMATMPSIELFNAVGSTASAPPEELQPPLQRFTNKVDTTPLPSMSDDCHREMVELQMVNTIKLVRQVSGLTEAVLMADMMVATAYILGYSAGQQSK